MTKKLEELLNLPDSKRIVAASKSAVTQIPDTDVTSYRDIADFDKIAAALPKISGLGDACDSEFDALAKRATEAYDDLMDLGMNVEARYSGRIFEVASSMLKNAIDAKSAKIDKKLKTIELQLKKQKLDEKTSAASNEIDASISGEGYIVGDRNSLISQFRDMKKE